MNDILKLRKVFFLFVITFSLASCLTNVDEEVELDPCDEITFTMNVKPIIDNNCVSCHNGGLFPNLSTYNSISANAAIVKDAVVTKYMPQGSPLSDADIQAISCWVDAGAPNN